MSDGVHTGIGLESIAVLAVDDHEINRRFLESALGPRVGTLALAASGHDAIALCRDGAFDIVLMDIHMPDMDGVTTWRHVRAGRADDGMRVIALTADNRPEEIERLRASGFHGFLAKPVAPEALLTALARVAAGAEGFVRIEQSRPSRSAVLDPTRAAGAAGNAGRSAELGRAFLPELDDAPRQLDALLREGRSAQAAEFLHRLRGAAGYVGAIRLQHATRLLEDSLQRGLDSSPGTLLVSWTRTVAATRSALTRSVSSG